MDRIARILCAIGLHVDWVHFSGYGARPGDGWCQRCGHDTA